jgi:hypothetical protein
LKQGKRDDDCEQVLQTAVTAANAEDANSFVPLFP